MRPLPRTLVRTLAAVATGTLAATLAATLTATVTAAPASAAPSTTLNPGTLPRGADVAGPHLEGRTVVDGAVRIRVKAPTVRLLGKSGTAYVVGTTNRQGGRARLLRLAADGTTTRLANANPHMSVLADDGQTVVTTRFAPRTTLTVRSATSGAVLASRTFRRYVSAIDAEGSRILLGDIDDTLLWDTATDALTRVSRLGGYEGDLSADVLAGYTKDPYLDGCTVVVRISTGERLDRSCRERVTTFNDDGSRMATVDILSDGIGPSYVAVRSATGARLAAYDVKGWFGEIRFETPTALLLETHGKRRTAVVRCTDAGCERAGDLSDTEPVRAGQPG